MTATIAQPTTRPSTKRSMIASASSLVVDVGTAVAAALALAAPNSAGDPGNSCLLAVSSLTAIAAVIVNWLVRLLRCVVAIPAFFWLATVQQSFPVSLDQFKLTDLVAPLEGMLLALTYAARAFAGFGTALGILLRLTAGSMLIAFGAIHLLYQQDIAGLIPGKIPGREVIPLLTGALQILLGVLILASARRAAVCAVMTSLLFASWLPAVHLPRLVAEPSIAEWQFAIMAVCLIGAMLDLSARLEGTEVQL